MIINKENLKQRFRLPANVHQSFGDELIGSCKLVVFELVKNAYDAGPNEVSDIKYRESPGISVKDDDDGGLIQTIKDVWLVLGNDHRRAQLAGTSGKKDATHRQVA